MSVPQLQMPLESLAQMCRAIHRAALHDAALAARLAGNDEQCAATSSLRQSFNNVLSQAQSQFPHPFVVNIPPSNEHTEALEFPVLTSQLLGAILALSSPMLTPDVAATAWSDTDDAAYDDL